LLGSVLVAVNPLMVIADPPGILGQKKAISHAHPYGIAEVAYAQMVFAEGRRSQKKKEGDEEIISNQSIVISGESGSGKTESSKYTLKHLVSRNQGASGQSSNLDERLLSSNPILEAFGNASTLRNHNSSRFGKFLKLHFLETKRPGDASLWSIAGASVVTYLLERSRITTHNQGERGYHAFYELRDGAPADVKESLGLNLTNDYRYMTARGDVTKMVGTKMKMDDKQEFRNLHEAFIKLGLAVDVRTRVYQALAAILHLGNVEFNNEERPEGDVAVVAKSAYPALEWAGKMFGLNPDALSLMLREHEVQAGSEMVTKRRDAAAASYARDAVAKAAYSQLFEWIVDAVNEALVIDGKDVSALPFIGVLDIFGFESFEKNDFEQLLINYTNEALQGTFNRQVFVAEIELYKREGLMTDDSGMAQPPDNSLCMELLAGKAKVMGLLKVIDAESQTPQANDAKMNKQLHRAFEKNACFMKPHPKDVATVFIIRHYAGAVVYTVGRFIEKNADRVPKEVGACFEKSQNVLVAGLFKAEDKAEKAKRAFGGASILGKFTAQVSALIDTLEGSRDSFIRCVKPSPAMIRTKDMGISWFDRRYVTQQLKCLSIPQTAEVLKSGLPTRVPYEVLTENYMAVLPEEAKDMWKRLGGGDLKSFMSALFWAFEVPPESYRTGVTRVFFKSGELATLDKIMESAGNWVRDPSTAAEKNKVVARFKYYYVRAVWRKVIVRQLVVDRFVSLVEKARGRAGAASKVQALFRMRKERNRLNRNKRGAVMAQKMWRAKMGRKAAQKRRDEILAEITRKAEEARRLQEEARLRAIEEARLAEIARLAAEKAAAEAAESERATMLAKVEELKAQEAERVKKAAQEAERMKKDTERLEAERTEEILRAQLAKEKEEKEAAEMQAKFDAEESERRAEEGRTTQKPRKSVVRAISRKSMAGLTVAQKQAAIEAAEKKIKADKEAWANSGKAGYMKKKEKGGMFGGTKWKDIFFMVKMVRSEMEIYVKGNSTGTVGEPKGKPKAVFKLSKGLKVSPLDDVKGAPKYLLELSDPASGVLQLGCATAKDREDWAEAIRKCVEGFKVSAAAQAELDKANALVVHAAIHGGEEVPVHDDYEDLDISKLPIQAQEQLSKIDSLLETGLLSKEEVDQLRPVILAQAKEMMSTMGNQNQDGYDTFPLQGSVAGGSTRMAGAFRPHMMRQTSNFDELGYTGEGNPNVMVVCDVCSILNMHGGQNCMVCNAKLPNPDAPKMQEKVQQRRMSVQINAASFIPPPSGFGPADGVWLSSVPFRNGGTFKAFVMDAVSVMDQQTWEQTAVYIVGCEFTNLTVHEQWTARHGWKWIEKWAAKLKAETKFAVPDFPHVENKEANSTRADTMRKLKGMLNDYLKDLMKSVTASNSQQFLDHELVDKFFKIKDNVLEELDQEQFQEAYKQVLSADLAASDANTPLTLEEMQIADDAGTLLITFIRGDGTTKAVDINNDRVQDLRSVCLTAIPRLKASQDLDNPQVIKELVPQALDVLEHLENALRVYNDSEAVMQASITGQVR